MTATPSFMSSCTTALAASVCRRSWPPPRMAGSTPAVGNSGLTATLAIVTTTGAWEQTRDLVRLLATPAVRRNSWSKRRSGGAGRPGAAARSILARIACLPLHHHLQHKLQIEASTGRTLLASGMFALRLAAQGPCLAGQTISAYRGVRRSVCTQLRGMATSGTGSGGTVAPPPPAAAEQQQQQQQPASSSVQPQDQQQPKVRNYPDEPRVGVGIVILRQLPPADAPEVLLIRRAKEPSKGRWLGQLQG